MKSEYLYGGKELQTFFGIDWDDSGARFQTTDGLFSGIDPLSEQTYRVSPYAYCAGDPVNYVDPEGQKPRIFIQKYVHKYGHVFVTTGEGENTLLYTYGRYGATYGSRLRNQHLQGDGVLKVMYGKYAQDYLKDVLQAGNMEIFTISSASDQSVNDYYEALLKKGKEVGPEVKKDFSRAKIIDVYDFLINNCVATSIMAINADQIYIQTATSVPLLLYWGLLSEGYYPNIIKIQKPENYLQRLIDQLETNDEE